MALWNYFTSRNTYRGSDIQTITAATNLGTVVGISLPTVCLCSAAASYTIQLPGIVNSQVGARVTFVRTDNAPVNLVTIAAQGALTTFAVLINLGDMVTIFCDGSNWRVESFKLATQTYTPTNQAAITTNAYKMLGFGAAASSPILFTPQVTGNLDIYFEGMFADATGANKVGISSPYYGLVSGGIPANNAAQTGTATNALQRLIRVPVISANGAFTSSGIAIALTLGSQYWIDLSMSANTGGDSCTLTSVYARIRETT